MSLLLDTSIIIRLEKNDKKTLEALSKLRESDPAPPSIAFISYFEFLSGLFEKNPKNKTKSMSFIELFAFLNPTKTTASILADIKYKYQKRGVSFSLSDLLIASQTLEHNMTLVTSDKHFEEIEELKKIIL